MPLFRRRRDDEIDEIDEDLDGDLDGDLDAASDSTDAGAPGRPSGPWDVEDLADDEVQRLDLGALRVPVPDGYEVRVDMQDEQVVAATVVDGRSALQIHAFAAPRSAGIWDEVRQEIVESLRSGGGSAEETEGPFGRELRARIPTMEQAQGQQQVQGLQLQPARFVGVDGPRWFLRGLMTGAASTDPNQARGLEAVFRGVVVVRGGEAMAPRDLLPLRLPREALQHLEGQHVDEQQGAGEQAKPTLEMLERGPEITETR